MWRNMPGLSACACSLLMRPSQRHWCAQLPPPPGTVPRTNNTHLRSSGMTRQRPCAMAASTADSSAHEACPAGGGSAPDGPAAGGAPARCVPGPPPSDEAACMTSFCWHPPTCRGVEGRGRLAGTPALLLLSSCSRQPTLRRLLPPLGPGQRVAACAAAGTRSVGRQCCATQGQLTLHPEARLWPSGCRRRTSGCRASGRESRFKREAAPRPTRMPRDTSAADLLLSRPFEGGMACLQSVQ